MCLQQLLNFQQMHQQSLLQHFAENLSAVCRCSTELRTASEQVMLHPLPQWEVYSREIKRHITMAFYYNDFCAELCLPAAKGYLTFLSGVSALIMLFPMYFNQCKLLYRGGAGQTCQCQLLGGDRNNPPCNHSAGSDDRGSSPW